MCVSVLRPCEHSIKVVTNVHIGGYVKKILGAQRRAASRAACLFGGTQGVLPVRTAVLGQCREGVRMPLSSLRCVLVSTCEYA
jgi:hypothetical protein